MGAGVAVNPSSRSTRTRRLFQVVIAAGALGAAVRCVLSASDRDWAGSLYFAVIAAASVGTLVGLLTWPMSATRSEHGEAKLADPSDAPLDAP
jgi:Na+/proline symporter